MASDGLEQEGEGLEALTPHTAQHPSHGHPTTALHASALPEGTLSTPSSLRKKLRLWRKNQSQGPAGAVLQDGGRGARRRGWGTRREVRAAGNNLEPAVDG